MNDRLEPRQRRGVAEHALGQALAVDRAVDATTPGNAASTASAPGAAIEGANRGVGVEHRRALSAQTAPRRSICPWRSSRSARRRSRPPLDGRAMSASISARNSRRHRRAHAEPALEPGRRLMQQHAEAVDRRAGRAPAPPRATAFQRNIDDVGDDRPRAAASRSRSSGGWPVMPERGRVDEQIGLASSAATRPRARRASPARTASRACSALRRCD